MKRRELLGVFLVALGLIATGIVYFGDQPSQDRRTHSLYEEPPAEALRVLFLGNSHTFVNDVPAMVQRVAHSHEGAQKLWVEMVARGGLSLDDLLQNGHVREELGESRWDFVVIQGRSLEPFVDPEMYVRSFQTLADASRAAGATPILFEVWPRVEGHSIYEQGWMPSNHGQAMDIIRGVSEQAISENESLLAPVGGAWVLAGELHPDINLYVDDGNHADLAGSQLTALVLYRVILGEDLPGELLWHPTAISSEDAARLQAVANKAFQWTGEYHP
ncbi:MAG: SGNH/GDSL hydrolase family protein [Bradymonadaceae bacterium]